MLCWYRLEKILQPGVGVGRYIVFALESSFRDIREDLASVFVSVFSISRNPAENSFSFSAFFGTLSKYRFCISCNFLFFFLFFSCFFLMFFPGFSSFFPVFSRFSLKNDVSCIVSFPIYAHFSSRIPYRFPFLAHFSSQIPSCFPFLAHFSPRIASPTPSQAHAGRSIFLKL